MNVVLDARRDSVRGSGYVLGSLWFAVHCLVGTSELQACLQRAVSLGNDPTTATIVGGLAGLLYGSDAIPERCITALHGRDKVDALLGKASQGR
jgi:ADP-ribosyl-[dinitrogen reductase] hydrolase